MMPTQQELELRERFDLLCAQGDFYPEKVFAFLQAELERDRRKESAKLKELILACGNQFRRIYLNEYKTRFVAEGGGFESIFGGSGETPNEAVEKLLKLLIARDMLAVSTNPEPKI